MFASMLGSFLTIIILTGILVGVITIIAVTASSDEVVIDKKTVLVMKLDKTIADRAPKMPVFAFTGTEKPTGLSDILKNLKKAKADKNISGIFLDLSGVAASMATVEEIREGLLDFKTSGKFVWAYSEGYDQKAYYVATASDRICSSLKKNVKAILNL